VRLSDQSRTVAFIYTADLDRALKFYTGTLGLGVRSRDDFGAFVEGSGALLRITPMPDFRAGPHPVAGWDVADITEAVAALRGAGISFTIFDGMGQDPDGIWTAPDGTARLAWFSDPDGNVLSLSQTQ
jgi:catechol 2,3-dioxygenase-like lactoylglutathione lyase family enzyme